MELWDLYTEDKKKLNKQVKRGSKLQDNEYHLVVNVWIKNSKGEFLIVRRSPNKSFPLMWECIGGSALAGETSLEAAIREVKEEINIELSKETAKLYETTLRHYEGCPDILDVWEFKSEEKIENMKIQEEEVCEVMWASREKILELYKENRFEANAFFEEIINTKDEKIYYVGFNANNAICNEKFFDGSITIYPNGEKGNIYYTDKVLEDIKSEKFLEKYKQFIEKTVKDILKNNKNTKFMYFNEKTRKLCENINYMKLIKNNDDKIVKILNNKFETRNLVKDKIPILEYLWIEGSKLDYEKIRKELSYNKFVLQAETGAGGEETYLIKNEEELKMLVDKNSNYCVSKYVNHLPLNATLIITKDGYLELPISVQLILPTNKKFKYVGGDFNYIKNVNPIVINKLKEYNKIIAKKITKLGYKGILGIDYLLCENNELVFMEINPRFQASSFLINLELERKYGTNLAKLHYFAINDKKIPNIKMNYIDKSFINCNNEENFDSLIPDFKIIAGYFKENKTSVYRKVFNKSILNQLTFEKTIKFKTKFSY